MPPTLRIYSREIASLDRNIHLQLRHHPGYNAVQAIYGVGRVFAAIFVAEIGDVTRFRSAEALCCCPGSRRCTTSRTPRWCGVALPKQGSKLVRWAALEAVARYHGGEALKRSFHDIAERRGKKRSQVATARKVLTLVYYGLRDGEIRCLRGQQAA